MEMFLLILMNFLGTMEAMKNFVQGATNDQDEVCVLCGGGGGGGGGGAQ